MDIEFRPPPPRVLPESSPPSPYQLSIKPLIYLGARLLQAPKPNPYPNANADPNANANPNPNANTNPNPNPNPNHTKHNVSTKHTD